MAEARESGKAVKRFKIGRLKVELEGTAHPCEACGRNYLTFRWTDADGTHRWLCLWHSWRNPRG